MANIELGFFERLIFSSRRNTVRILMDLDGCLSPEGQLEDGDYQTFASNGYATWRLRHRVIQWLLERYNDPRVELVWSTTWQEYANTIFEELGLEPIEWLKFNETYQSIGDWYKKDAIIEFLEDHKDPIVILDDELPDTLLAVQNPRILTVKPDSLIGITDSDLSRIDDFIKDYRKGKIRPGVGH